MRKAGFMVVLVTLSFGTVTAALSQNDESPSLGDIARQARLAKQQKDTQTGTVVPGQSVSGQSKDGGAGANAAQATTSQSATTTAAQKNAPSAQSRVERSNGSSTTSKIAPAGKRERKVITNEAIEAAHITAASSPEPKTDSAEPASSDVADGKNPPDYWTRRTFALKDAIASLKNDIDQLSASIQYAPGNCVEGCVEWNERQQQKQQQVDAMKAQLEEQQKQLEEMQEAARKQGYGSSVYDP